mmetsp:Transcript_3525/g.6678  ORF Transcript_3525/g.6678 Transcript_3525/m.6678 type:complete len:580 (+) Transcript_3525:26-1765(+)
MPKKVFAVSDEDYVNVTPRSSPAPGKSSFWSYGSEKSSNISVKVKGSPGKSGYRPSDKPKVRLSYSKSTPELLHQRETHSSPTNLASTTCGLSVWSFGTTALKTASPKNPTNGSSPTLRKSPAQRPTSAAVARTNQAVATDSAVKMGSHFRPKSAGPSRQALHERPVVKATFKLVPAVTDSNQAPHTQTEVINPPCAPFKGFIGHHRTVLKRGPRCHHVDPDDVRAHYEDKLSEANTKLLALTRDNDQLSQLYKATEREIQKLTDSLEAKKAEHVFALGMLQTKFNELKDRHSICTENEEKVAMLTRKNEDLTEELRKTKSEKIAVTSQLTESMRMVLLLEKQSTNSSKLVQFAEISQQGAEQRAQKSKKLLEELREETESNNSFVKDKLDTLETQLEVARNAHSGCGDRYAVVKEALGQRTAELSRTQSEFVVFKMKHTDCYDTIKDLESKRDLFEERLKVCKNRLEQTTEILKNTKIVHQRDLANLKHRQGQLDQASANKQKVQDQLDKTKEALEKLEHKSETQETIINTLKVKLSSAEKKAAHTEQLNDRILSLQQELTQKKTEIDLLNLKLAGTG